MWRFCAILFIGALLEVQSAPAEVGKSKEKVRAYEFGYSIEENQHRHEKRDENGIVMGEFGFITADGIYHVTVYATDENGKFKILAMKNYPYRSPEKKAVAVTTPPPKKPLVLPPLRKATPLDTPSCGGCILTKKLTDDADDIAEQVPENPEAVFRPLSRTINDLPATKPSVGLAAPQPNAIGSPAAKATPGSSVNGKEYPLTNSGKAGQPVVGNRQSKTFAASGQPNQVAPRFGQSFNTSPPNPLTTSNGPPSLGGQNKNTPPQGQRPIQNTLTPNTVLNAKEKSFQPLNKVLPSSLGPSNNVQPTQNTNSLRKQTVTATITPIATPKNALGTPQLINSKTPTGLQQPSTNALPGARTPTSPNLPSTTKLTPFTPSNGKATPTTTGGGPLYRFKYVLDYNGHREEGRADGSKEGKYNTIDEDGIRRIIDYIANENGYQPHIKWERIPASELPTGENKLKEYEFVWFN